MKLSDTQTQILTAAAQHPHGLTEPPERLPTAARQTVGKALLKNDLVIAVQRPDCDARTLWPIDGDSLLLRITDEGLRAIGIDPNEGDSVADTASPAAPEVLPHQDNAPAAAAAQGAPLVPDEALVAPAPVPRSSLREAATSVLAVWGDETNRTADIIGALEGPMARLRVLVVKPTAAAREPGTPRKPREGTKQEAVLTLLRRPEGATVAQIAETTGWQAHTVRGFFAGLKKRGIEVSVLERVRQVGPGKDGAKGSYTIYRIDGRS